MKMVFVEVVKLNIGSGSDKPIEVIERMGPMTEGKAEKVEMGLLRNMNLEEYSTQTVEADDHNL